MFTERELTAFAINGTLVKRGFVPLARIVQATSLIEDWYQHRMSESDLTSYTQKTFAPELGSHPALLGLFTETKVTDLATELLGNIRPVETVQIQIRVPEQDLSVAQQPEKVMHVDGVACPHLDPEELRTFSLLVGITLSSITDPQGGALRYVQGGHLTMADWFRSEWALGVTEQTPPQIDSVEGTPFLGEPGDVLLMHHLVPHSVGRNYTQWPRIMGYFRVSHVDHADRRMDALKDPWLDYPTISRLQADTTR